MPMKLVNTKQFALTAFIIIMAQKILILPSYMVKTGGRSSYISMLIMLLAEILILLAFMFTIRLAKDKSFYALLDKGATRIGGRAIAVVMLVGMLLKCLLLISEIRAFFNINLNESLVDFVAILPMCVFLFMIATKTLRGIGRLAEIMSPFILLVMLILFVFVVGHIDFKWMLPIAENGAKPLAKNIYMYPLWFADIPFMFVFLGQVKREKRFMLYGILGAVAGGVIVLFFSTIIFMSYGNMPHLLEYGNNISHMLIYSTLNYVYGRFDILIFCVWIFTVFLQLGLVFYGITRNIKYIFSADHNKLIAFLSLAVIYVLIVIVFKNEHVLHSVCLMPFARLAALFNMLVVPVFVLLVAVVLHCKRQRNRWTMLAGLRPSYRLQLRNRSIKYDEI